MRVARDRMARFDELLLLHRERTPYAEVDLVLRRRDGILTLIEVKSWDREIWASHVITQKQVRRLTQARFYLESKYARPVVMLLALVPSELWRQIHYFEDFPAPGY